MHRQRHRLQARRSRVTGPDKHPSIEGEPHLTGKPFSPDPSEEKADRTPTKSIEEGEAAEQGVWEEPGLSPHLAGPVPLDQMTYGDWMEKRAEEMSTEKTWLITFGLILLAGPLSILGTFAESFFQVSGGVSMTGLISILAIVAFGPLIEEVMKLAGPLWIVEKRPFFFSSRIQILLCALAGGFFFGVIENLVYLNIYISDPPETLVYWRWTVCLFLHSGCSFIGGLGLARIWSQAWEKRQRPSVAVGYPYIVTAFLIHGSYNGLCVLMELTAFRF